ncbi:unnamed protein product, partial [marine sediment metagenome]
MRTVLIIFTAIVLGVLAECNGAGGGKELLSVDFQEAQTLRYKFVSSKDINVNWDPMGKRSRPGKKRVDKSTELIEMVAAYTPVEVDPYGLTTIKATCESVKVKRSSSTSRQVSEKDAVRGFAGKTFTFTVDPGGRIEDYSQLSELIREVGKKAFPPRRKKVRVKAPDMIG